MCTPGNFSSCSSTPIISDKPEVGAEGQFADAVAVFVGVAIVPEFLFEVFPRRNPPSTRRAPLISSVERRALQVAILAVEMIARGGVADERAVHRGGSGENFARREIRPVARADQAAGFYPVEAGIEMRGEGSAGFGFHGERFGCDACVREACR